MTKKSKEPDPHLLFWPSDVNKMRMVDRRGRPAPRSVNPLDTPYMPSENTGEPSGYHDGAGAMSNYGSGAGLHELREKLDEAMAKTLTQKERQVIELRYGLADGYAYTPEEIGYMFKKVTSERIQQIVRGAIRKLQASTEIRFLYAFEDFAAEADANDRRVRDASHTTRYLIDRLDSDEKRQKVVKQIHCLRSQVNLAKCWKR